MTDIALHDMPARQRFGYIISQMLTESSISPMDFAAKIGYTSACKSQLQKLLSEGATRETVDTRKIMETILDMCRSDVGAKWMRELRKAYDELPSHPFKRPAPIDEKRKDFGAVLGRILNESDVSYRQFSRLIDPKSTLGIAANIVGGQLPSKEWVRENKIESLLQDHCADAFQKHKQDFDKGFAALPDSVTIHDENSLSGKWARVAANFINAVLEHNGDDLEDVVDELKKHPLSYRLKFFQEAQNWELIAEARAVGLKSVAAYRQAVTIFADTYLIDKENPLYPARREAELALGAK